MNAKDLEAQIHARLLDIHRRLEWISNAEERSAWVQGAAAEGVFEPERERLLKEAELLIERWEASRQR